MTLLEYCRFDNDNVSVGKLSLLNLVKLKIERSPGRGRHGKLILRKKVVEIRAATKLS